MEIVMKYLSNLIKMQNHVQFVVDYINMTVDVIICFVVLVEHSINLVMVKL